MSTMIINGFKLPQLLEADLRSGRRPLLPEESNRLRALIYRVESPLPALFSFDGILDANSLWESEYYKYYLGLPSYEYSPGNIDPTLTLIIGQAEPDSPIALDYRTAQPRVVYYGDVNNQSYWFELSPSYEKFIDMLRSK